MQSIKLDSLVRRRLVQLDLGDNRGMAIGPILFIVALLGVLAAAIAGSTGSFKTSSSGEEGKSAASAILQVGDTLKDGFEKLMLQQNVTVTNFRMLPSKTTASTDVFSSSGGNIIYPTTNFGGSAAASLNAGNSDVWYFLPLVTNYSLAASTYNYWTGLSSNPVMVAFLVVPKATCDAINTLVVGKAISAPYASNALYYGFSQAAFNGFWSTTPLTKTTQGCFSDGEYWGWSGYLFFQVLGSLNISSYLYYGNMAHWQALSTEPIYAGYRAGLASYVPPAYNNSGN